MNDVASPLLKLLATLLMASAIALAWWWLPPQSAAVLSAPLLIAAAIVWLQRASAPAAAAVHIEPHIPHEGLSSRARVNALESELTSLRGVQRELLAAKQAAESAMLAKSEFLATMSHEIRTPLNGILPLLDIVLGMPLEPTQRDYLATAHKSAQELLRIVDDILDYSKVEAGKLELEKVGFNLREVMDNVFRLMEKPAEAKGLTLRVVVDDDVRAGVRGDSVRVRQILTNLVGNAIKFTERGGVSVRVSRRSDSTTHHELLFAVRDTGIGLAPEQAGKLFQPFTQADASVTRRYGGTGLGLTICKKLVELMGGKIGVRSEAGRGSVFWFSIPFEKLPGDIAGARRDLTGLRTLLACGEAFAQRATPILAGVGLETTHVDNTAAALTRLRQVAPLGRAFSFELLVVDASTLDGDVTALLRNVMRDPKLASLRVLALGGVAETDPRITGIARDADDGTLRAALQMLFGMPERGRPKPLLGIRTPETANAAERQLRGHVLLVEDHPVNQQVARRLLERLGLKVETAGHGAEALERIKQHRYDLVLMDCQMPVLDGYSATRRLREQEQRDTIPRLPVIAMTAHAMAGDRERCLEAGMDDYLTKPLDRLLLSETLARWLGAGGTAATGVQAAAVPPHVGLTTAVATAPQRASTAAVMVAAPMLDEATLADLEEIMGEEVRGLVQAYLHDGDARLLALRVAADRKDAVEVGKLAHSLKSASANVGAKILSAEAKAVEQDARNGTLADPNARVATLERLYAQTAAALRQKFELRG
jgi:signal transduction histidine kinase/CheY-like chemotaxis protein/HPt (histidine-containing phosphotransfer) domain-containing protein